jgi:hypothetical protein
MAKKKSQISRREVRDCIKEHRAIVAAWEKAGCPKEGIVLDGMRHKPLPFAEMDGPKFKAAKAGK